MLTVHSRNASLRHTNMVQNMGGFALSPAADSHRPVRRLSRDASHAVESGAATSAEYFKLFGSPEEARGRGMNAILYDERTIPRASYGNSREVSARRQKPEMAETNVTGPRRRSWRSSGSARRRRR
jgi:hypothetical protein